MAQSWSDAVSPFVRKLRSGQPLAISAATAHTLGMVLAVMANQLDEQQETMQMAANMLGEEK